MFGAQTPNNHSHSSPAAHRHPAMLQSTWFKMARYPIHTGHVTGKRRACKLAAKTRNEPDQHFVHIQSRHQVLQHSYTALLQSEAVHTCRAQASQPKLSPITTPTMFIAVRTPVPHSPSKCSFLVHSLSKCSSPTATKEWPSARPAAWLTVVYVHQFPAPAASASHASVPAQPPPPAAAPYA